MLQPVFTQLLQKYTSNNGQVEMLWQELEKLYNSKGRYYHTLQHLQNMYMQLQEVQTLIEDWDTMLFSLFYHDIIYSVTAKGNEEKSAKLAEKRLLQTNFPEEKIRLCVQHILATKSHNVSPNLDTNYFTDADLSILGAEWTAYETYTKVIRKEYAIYPDLLYKPGRGKVLHHFLGMEKIYKTDYFYKLYEAKARENMEKELLML